MLQKRNYRKAAFLMAMAVLFGSMTSSLTVEAKSDNLPAELILPITLIDYNADNLLFQYDLGDSIGTNFAFTSDEFYNELISAGVQGLNKVKMPDCYGWDCYYMEGLVESELGSNGTPVYKKEVVEQVAELVQSQLIAPATNNTSPLFADLRARLIPASTYVYKNITNDTDLVLTGPKEYFYEITGYTWTVSGGDATCVKADGKISRQESGTTRVIWETNGDGVTYKGDGDSDDALVMTVTGLDSSATYQIESWNADYNAVNLLVAYGSVTLDTSDPGQRTFTGTDTVTLTILPSTNLNSNNKVAATYLKNTSDESRIDLISDPANAGVFTNSGWYVKGAGVTYAGKKSAAYDAGGTAIWKFIGDGLVGYMTDYPACRELDVRPGAKFEVTYSYGSDVGVAVYDAVTNEELGKNMENGDIFTVPATTTKVRLEVTSSKQATTGDGDYTRDKLVNLSVTEKVDCLGNYEESKAKYADGTKGYADVASAMDYAYYMLNNLFVSKTDAMVKTPYDGYQNITLSQVQAGEDDYEFRANISGMPVSVHGSRTEEATLTEQYKMVYDLVSKNIRNDRSELGNIVGLFPLDAASSMEADEYKGVDGQPHNFHYALKSHSEFHYDEATDLYFTFLGDDDVYLYINGKLALDLGGAHMAATKSIHLNDYKTELGLVSGETYTFDFFYMERCTGYSNFYVETNIQLLGAGDMKLNLYQEDKLLADGSKVDKGSEVELEYVLESRVDHMKNINFADSGLGINVGVNGLKIGKNIRLAKNGVRISVLAADGSVKETVNYLTEDELKGFFNALVLNQGEKISVRGLFYTVEDTLDADVSVVFDRPLYAGALGNFVTNTTFAEGSAQAEATQPAPPGNSQNTNSTTDDTGHQNDGGNHLGVSPETGDGVETGNLLLAGMTAVLGLIIAVRSFRRKIAR